MSRFILLFFFVLSSLMGQSHQYWRGVALILDIKLREQPSVADEVSIL